MTLVNAAAIIKALPTCNNALKICYKCWQVVIQYESKNKVTALLEYYDLL